MTENDIVVLPFNREILDKTAVNTIKKYSFTNSSTMYGRTPVELLDNIFMGDLAKNSLLAYLRERCDREIIDYDEIREDGFREPDPGWDFMVGNQQIKLEVKSSIPPHGGSRSALINSCDIKITASHDKGQTWIMPDTLESDIHVQVYFYAGTCKEGYTDFQALQNDLESDPDIIHQILNTDKYREPLFFGCDTKKNIIERLEKLPLPKCTWTYNGTNRIYWHCPIREAFTMNALIRFINTH